MREIVDRLVLLLVLFVGVLWVRTEISEAKQEIRQEYRQRIQTFSNSVEARFRWESARVQGLHGWQDTTLFYTFDAPSGLDSVVYNNGRWVYSTWERP